MSDTVTQMLVGENLRKVLEAQPLNPLGQLTLAGTPTSMTPLHSGYVVPKEQTEMTSAYRTKDLLNVH